MLDTQAPDSPPTPNLEADADPEVDVEETLPSLFRHTKRNTWGLGLMIRKLPDRAYMQFQDGRMRLMHLDYAEMLEPVDRPYDIARGLVEALESMAPDELRPGKRRGPAPFSLKEQIAYFHELYADGFRGDEYTEYHRSDGRKRPLKRHRDGLVERAQKNLGKAGFKRLRKKGGASAVHKEASKIANLTGLVPAKERRAFAEIDDLYHESIATTLRALLHGTSPLPQRLDAWVRALEQAMGQTPSWMMATAFLGAWNPEGHVVVKPKTIEQQARFMAPGLRAGERPMGILYARLQAMAATALERMDAEGLAPRDMLDLYDFMWLTLKPAGRKRMSEMRRQAELRAPVTTTTTTTEESEAEAA